MKKVLYVDIGKCVVGERADVIAYDHPTAPNNVWIRTSIVQHIVYTRDGPVIITMNTLYSPYPTAAFKEEIVDARPSSVACLHGGAESV
jgi:hypothetical protein